MMYTLSIKRADIVIADCIKPIFFHIKSQPVAELCVLPAPVRALHRSLKNCPLETTEVLRASYHLMTQLGPRSRTAPATSTTF